MRKDKKCAPHRNRPKKRGKRSVAQRRWRRLRYNEQLQKKELEKKAAEARRNNPNPLEKEVTLPDCGTTQALQFKANDTPVCLDANISVPYFKQEIVEPVVSQTLPCHTLSQEMVEPVVSQNLPCHTLIHEITQTPVSSSSSKSKVFNITERILPERSSLIDLPYNAVCTERIAEPVPDFLPEKRQWIVKKKVLLSTHGRNGKTTDSCGIKHSDVGDGWNNAFAGKRLMTLEETYCTSNKLHKTHFTYSSSQRKPKQQIDQSIKNSWRTQLIRPAVPHVSSHTALSGKLIPPEKMKVEEEFEVVENEFHDSPEAVMSSLNQKKWNSSLSGSCLNPVTTMIARSPSTQWFTNSCTSAVTTETVTTFASTSNKTVCTSTSALSTACLSSTSTTPILISSYAQPSIPSSSLPIKPARNVPMIRVPHKPAAKSNSDLIFNSLLPKQSNQAPLMVKNIPFVANNLNKNTRMTKQNTRMPELNTRMPEQNTRMFEQNTRMPKQSTRISEPSSNVNSSLPIQTVVLNPTINSTLCDTSLSSTLGLPDKPISVKVENGFNLFDKDADVLLYRNNATLSDVNTALSDTKGTTLPDRKCTTLLNTKSTTLPDRKCITLLNTKSTTLPDRKCITLLNTKSTTLPDRKCTTLLNTKSTTLPDRKCITLLNTMSTTLLNTKNTTPSGQNSTSLSDRITTTLCDRKNITLSDKYNATLSGITITCVPDRNTTTSFDSIISNVPKQNTSMISNRSVTVSAVGAPSTALSLNNSAQKQDSLTITMPSYAASFASKTVSNDEGSKEKIAFGEKAQKVLGEVADKLSKILPDTSFVKYLTDPDFYFFIGLLPLIHMLSVQQKVHAQILIKRILYDLAYPATSTSLATSN